MWHILPKPVYEWQTDHSDIEDEDTTDVGDAGIESFGFLFTRGYAHNGLQN